MASLLMYSSLVLIYILFSFTEASDILVGGKPNFFLFNLFLTKLLSQLIYFFALFDVTVWKFDAQKDSILRVSREIIAKIEFDQSGPFYFVSGIKGNCERGQKLVVVVMTKFHNGIAPAPSPMGFGSGPVVAPSSGSHSLKTGSFLGALLVTLLFHAY
ncbi:hypothetical protein MKX01_022943 [Papaver californicum]|nr:hypothetical protein MKX01_022943 [Papaver californicum]